MAEAERVGGGTLHDPPWLKPGAVRYDRAQHRGPYLLLLAGASLACGALSWLGVLSRLRFLPQFFYKYATYVSGGVDPVIVLAGATVMGVAMGLVAAMMTYRDLGKVRAGLMDPAGSGQTRMALALAWAGILLSLLLIICLIGFVSILFVARTHEADRPAEARAPPQVPTMPTYPLNHWAAAACRAALAAALLWPLMPAPARPEAQPAGAAANPGGPVAPGEAVVFEPDPAVLFGPGKGQPDAAAVLAVAVAPDGKTLAVATEDNAAQLRDAGTGQLRHTLPGHADVVTGLAFARAGDLLATGSADRDVKLWDPATGRERLTLRGHTGWVYALAFAPDGKCLASAAYDKTVRLWDPPTGQTTGTLRGHKASVRAVAFAPDGRTLASGGADRTVLLWDLGTAAPRAVLKGHQGTVRAVAFAPDGKTLASAAEDGTVKLWDTASGRERASLRGHAGEVWALAFAPGGEVLASGGQDRAVKLWDVTAGALRGHLEGHADAVSTLAFAPDGRRLFSGSADKTVRRWTRAAPPTAAYRAERLRQMAGLVKAIQLARVEKGMPVAVELLPGPLLRYLQPEVGVVDQATVWGWGGKGRPAALLALAEFRQRGRPVWSYELVSLADGPLRATAGPRLTWSPQRPGLELRPLAGAPAPAGGEAERLAQMRKLGERFVAREQVRGQSITLKLSAQPLCRYAEPAAGLTDGAVFTFNDGGNPDVVLVLEARRRGAEAAAWRYGLAPFSAATLAVELDGHEVWREVEGRRLGPQEPYWIAVVPKE
jgi:WD40 repeat protein